MLANRDPFVRWFDVFNNPRDHWVPPVAISRNDDGCKLLIDMPGVPKEALQITHDSGVLSIEGDRPNLDNEQVIRQDQVYGHFKHRFSIPNSLDVDRVQASLKDGVLEVRLPSRETSKAITINVS